MIAASAFLLAAVSTQGIAAGTEMYGSAIIYADAQGEGCQALLLAVWKH